ncbi:MAG: hypothetical protein AABX33_02420 [Nanoarchaeota archaeon]
MEILERRLDGVRFLDRFEDYFREGASRPFYDYFTRRFERRFDRENQWEGLTPGDVVEYNGRNLRYWGLEQWGGPGNFKSEPIFVLADVQAKPNKFYLREVSDKFPEDVYSENSPTLIVEGELPPSMPKYRFRVTYEVRFLNATRADLKKVGHITLQEWCDMQQAWMLERVGDKVKVRPI